MPTLHIYVIHTQALTTRQPRLHGSIQAVRELAQGAGFTAKIQMILEPDASELAGRLNTYSERISYNPVGDEDFDKAISQLSVEELSNMEKHVEAWRRITALDAADGDVYMVIEDDFVVLPEGKDVFVEFLQVWRDGDIAFLGLSSVDPKWRTEPLVLLPTRNTYKTLPCKDSYVIRREICDEIVREFTTGKLTFTLRNQLAYWIWNNDNIKALYPSKRIFIDGSKVGTCPSSVHPNNMLLFNHEYMELWKMLQSGAVDVATARAIYRGVEGLRHPDIMHVYGVLLYKAGQVDAAADILNEAIDQIQKQQGILGSRSDLLNNLINLYQNLQKDI